MLSLKKKTIEEKLDSEARQNIRIIERYTNQPSEIPAYVRRAVRSSVGEDDLIQLYALSDISPAMQNRELWVVLTEKNVVLARVNGDGVEAAVDVQTIPRTRIKSVEDLPGLSAAALILRAEPDEPALAVLRYSQRQKRAFANLQFVLEEAIKGNFPKVRDANSAYQEAIAQPIQEAQALVAGNQSAVVWRLLSYLKPYRRQVTAGMTAAVLMTLMAMVPPLLTGRLIDNVIRPYEQGAMSLEQASSTAWWMILVLAVAYALRELFAWIRLRTMSMMGELVAKDLRNELYAHLQKLSLQYFSKKQTGSIISRVSSDTDRIWDFVAFGVVEVSISIVTLTVLAGAGLYLDWRLGLIMTLPIPVFLYAIFRHGEQMEKIFLRAWRKWSNLTDVLSDTIPGIRVVKAFHKERYETNRFRKRNANVVDEFQNVHRTWTSFWPLMMGSIHVVMLLVWCFAVPRIVNDPNAVSLSTGTLVSFLFFMTMYIAPIEIIGQMARMMNRATSSAHRIFEVLDSKPDLTDRPRAKKLDPVQGAIRFENVTFSYDGVRQILKGMDFEVEPGEMIGLVGPTGAGKSTVTNLIARFYEATGGKIFVDGVNIDEIDSGHYRTQIGMVLQEPYLFHGTILDNIRYGQPGASLSEVVEAAQVANAHEFICRLPQGYDTIVGERGQSLSGGERQRVSIARAVLHNPRILILDEATSAVDSETERKIQEALDRLVEGRTVFAIAHRLSTLAKADRLFVIDDGRIKEEGTHSELISLEDGLYKKLCMTQQRLELSPSIATA